MTAATAPMTPNAVAEPPPVGCGSVARLLVVLCMNRSGGPAGSTGGGPGGSGGGGDGAGAGDGGGGGGGDGGGGGGGTNGGLGGPNGLSKGGGMGGVISCGWSTKLIEPLSSPSRAAALEGNACRLLSITAAFAVAATNVRVTNASIAVT